MLRESFLNAAPLFPFLHYFGSLSCTRNTRFRFPFLHVFGSLSATILYILGRVPTLGGRYAA